MSHATSCVRTPLDPSDPHAAVAPPLYQTATFGQSSAAAEDRYDYSRSGNPTRAILEHQLATLEDGTHAFAFASGMAAIDAVVRTTPAGGTIIAGTDLYGGTHRYLTKIAAAEGRRVRLVNFNQLEEVERSLQQTPGMVIVESPTNPRMRIADIRSIAAVTRHTRSLLAVDNTMLSPILQQPLQLGADIVLHSATKHLGGHSDVTAGAVITRNATIADKLAFIQNACGNALAPFDAWLLLRGIKTLALRVERAQENAQFIAEWLDQRDDLSSVSYVGLDRHPQKTLHESQADGPGTVISFETGSLKRSENIINALPTFATAVSFGGVGSSVNLPCRMSHASIPPEERKRLCLPADLVRLSIGIESVSDLIAELEHALESSGAGSQKPNAKILANRG